MKEMLQLFRNKVYTRFFLANILERLGSMNCWNFFNVLFVRPVRKTTSLRNDDTNYDGITRINLFSISRDSSGSF